MILATQVFEECELRGQVVPGPYLDISRFRSVFAKAFEPVPMIEGVLQKHTARKCQVILKFGDMSWLPNALEHGDFLISPASYYEKNEHNHARKDQELTRKLKPNPRRTDIDNFLLEQGITPPLGKVVDEITVRATCDYYLFSLCAIYSSRLFGDFNSSACLVIYNQKLFVDRLVTAMRKALPAWECRVAPVRYYDPIRAKPHQIDARFFKPFRHAYQNELRIVWTPRDVTTVVNLTRLSLALGPLTDCAEIVDLQSYPPSGAVRE